MPIPTSMKHVQSCYHRPLLTQLFKTDSKSKLNFVAIFPYLLYFLNFCFHHLDKIYSQKGERGKGGGERGKENPNLNIGYWSFNEPGQEGWVKRTPDKNTTISNFKVKTIKNNNNKTVPRAQMEGAKESQHTLTAPADTQGREEQTSVSPTPARSVMYAIASHMQCKTLFQNRVIDMKRNNL